jgi:hypothetical protein
VELLQDGSVRTHDGRILKKKVIGNRKVADEKDGLEWEVVDKKRTVIVETSKEPGSDSD